MNRQKKYDTRQSGFNRLTATVTGLLCCSLPLDVWASIYAKTPSGLPESPVPGNSLLYTFLGLLLVIAVIIGGAWLLRRLVGLPMMIDGSLKVVAGLSLGTRERVVLLQVGEEQILLGVAPGRIQTLHKLDTPVTPHQRAHGEKRGANRFAERLLAAVKQGKST